MEVMEAGARSACLCLFVVRFLFLPQMDADAVAEPRGPTWVPGAVPPATRALRGSPATGSALQASLNTEPVLVSRDGLVMHV